MRMEKHKITEAAAAIIDLFDVRGLHLKGPIFYRTQSGKNTFCVDLEKVSVFRFYTDGPYRVFSADGIRLLSLSKVSPERECKITASIASYLQLLKGNGVSDL